MCVSVCLPANWTGDTIPNTVSLNRKDRKTRKEKERKKKLTHVGDDATHYYLRFVGGDDSLAELGVVPGIDLAIAPD